MKTVLSLDGGGIRGLITLSFLCTMERLWGIRCVDAFDMIVGTSIGSILALGMVANGWSAQDMYARCTHDSICELFSSDWWWFAGSRYNGRGKRSIIERWLPCVRMNQLATSVRIPVYNLSKAAPVVLDNQCADWCVRDAADASSAAPTYFPPVMHGGEAWGDGGIFANNPCMVAVTEAAQMWGMDQVRVLSVGTGHETTLIDGKKAASWSSLGWYQHNILDILMDAPMNMISLQCASLLGPGRYVRVDPDLTEFHMKEVLDDTKEKTCSSLLSVGADMCYSHKDQLTLFLGRDPLDEDDFYHL